MPKVQISISIDDAHISQIPKIVKDLESLGMNVGQTLPGIGIISGSVSSEQLNSLKEIEGVQQIESEQSYQIAPPSSDVQ
jgi:hypothetical protein